MKIRIKLEKENLFCILVLWIWGQTILLSFLRAVISRLPFMGRDPALPDIILTGVFIILILLATPAYRLSKKDFAFLASVICIYLGEMAFYADGQEFLDQYLIDFGIKVLPLYIIGVSLGNAEYEDVIIYRMYLVSIITLIVSITYRFLFSAPMDEVVSKYEGDMYHAYSILPHCCLIAYYTIAAKKGNFLNIACMIIGGVYLLMLGSRGPSLIYLALITTLTVAGKNYKRTIVKTICFSLAIYAFIVSPWYHITLLTMYEKANQWGLSVRVFDKLMTGMAVYSSGRDVIEASSIDIIKESSIIGNGLFSDRVLLGGYAHNIALELWLDFGIIFGTIALLAIIIVLFRGYCSSQKILEKGLILTLIFSSFFRLFMSGSYLDEGLLFLLLGICVCSIRKNRNINSDFLLTPNGEKIRARH